MEKRARSWFWAHNTFVKRYIEHVQAQEPHERRQHAMRLAGAITVAVFAVWITTLGFRLNSNTQLAAEDDNSLTATVAQSLYSDPNQLIVATTTEY